MELTQTLTTLMQSFSYNYKGVLITLSGSQWVTLGRSFDTQAEAEKRVDNALEFFRDSLKKTA